MTFIENDSGFFIDVADISIVSSYFEKKELITYVVRKGNSLDNTFRLCAIPIDEIWEKHDLDLAADSREWTWRVLRFILSNFTDCVFFKDWISTVKDSMRHYLRERK